MESTVIFFETNIPVIWDLLMTYVTIIIALVIAFICGCCIGCRVGLYIRG